MEGSLSEPSVGNIRKDMNKELLIRRICSGQIILSSQYKYKHPNSFTRYRAEEIFTEAYDEAYYDMLSESEIYNFMLRRNIWSETLEKNMEQLSKDIDNMKKNLLQYEYQPQKYKQLKSGIAQKKRELSQLYHTRHQFDYVTSMGYAVTCKKRFLVSQGACTLEDKPVEHGEINKILTLLSYNEIDESQYRILARCEQWSGMWMGGKTSFELFGVPAMEMTEEQTSLIVWSNLYQNIKESPKCPSDFIIDDDDALDGWLLIQREERDKENERRLFEEKYRGKENADQVYCVANSPEEIEYINRQNDAAARLMKQRREKELLRRGEIDEREMPDTKMKLLNQLSGKGR